MIHVQSTSELYLRRLTRAGNPPSMGAVRPLPTPFAVPSHAISKSNLSSSCLRAYTSSSRARLCPRHALGPAWKTGHSWVDGLCFISSHRSGLNCSGSSPQVGMIVVVDSSRAVDAGDSRAMTHEDHMICSPECTMRPLGSNIDSPETFSKISRGIGGCKRSDSSMTAFMNGN